jgi:hypothetical protein
MDTVNRKAAIEGQPEFAIAAGSTASLTATERRGWLTSSWPKSLRIQSSEERAKTLRRGSGSAGGEGNRERPEREAKVMEAAGGAEPSRDSRENDASDSITRTQQSREVAGEGDESVG